MVAGLAFALTLAGSRNADGGQDHQTDGANELERFGHYASTTDLPDANCRVNFSATAANNPFDCAAGTCRQYGKPTPFGDDICGDGTIDENVTGRFARGTILDELSNRVASLGNFYIGTVNGPFLRFDTLEDIYGVEAGDTFQGAVSVSNRDLDTTANSTTNYGFAVDDMVAEWTETHPIAQSPLNKCAISTPTFGAGEGTSGTSGGTTGSGTGGASRTGGGDTATGGPQAPEPDVAANSQAQCAGMAVASDVLFEASTSVSIQVVDTNAATTQGTFNCCKYSPAPAGCISGPVYSNDCDSDGLKEVEVTVFNQEEPAGQSVGAAGQGGGGFSASAGADTRDQGETFKLEQLAPSGAGFDTYRGTVAVSSVLNQKGDGRIFVQWRASAFPQFVVRYVDKDDGVTGTSIGADGKPGLPNVDDDFDSLGPDRKPGTAGLDDDGTGVCDRQSGNYGALCNSDPGICTENGHCQLIDDAREGCRDRNNDGTINQADAFGDDQCLPLDSDGDGTTDIGVDETDELCPRGIKTFFSDDSCGCALNPIQQTVISDFDNADIIVSAFKVFDNINGGDNDGIPDDQEKDKMRVTVRNLSTGRLENVKLRLNTRDKDIACITDNLISTKGGLPITLNQSAFFQTDDANGDTFEFVVDNPGNDRNHDGTVNDIFRDVSATFQVTATGDIIDSAGNRKPFFGTVAPATFSMELDLDASVSNSNTLKATDKKVIIFNQIGSAQCSTNKECYNRTANDANNFYKKWTASAFPNRAGLHCQLNDPTNPNVHAVSPVGCFIGQTLNGSIFVDNDRDGTSEPGNTDWHFHGIWSRSNNILGNETRGHSSSGADTNEGALHMGFHDQNGSGTCRDPDGVTLRTCENSGGPGASQSYGPAQDVDFDTTHFDNLFEIHYNVPFRIGLGRGDFDGTAGVDEERPTLSFWHQVSLSRAFGDSVTWDGAVVMALVDRTDDGTINVGSSLDNTKDGQWKKLTAYYGVPNQQPISFINCKWDPDDDGSTEKDLFPADTLFGPSTLCFPEILWGCVGDTQDAPYDPGGNQFQAADSCYPETRLEFNAGGVDENGDGTVNGGDSGIAGCTNRNCNGTGNWVETKFDLSAFKGRSIFLRFLTGSAALVGSRTWMDFLQLGGNLDDGWYIDDMVLTGLQCGGNQVGNAACGPSAQRFVLRADGDAAPSNTCPASNCSTPPSTILTASTYHIRSNGLDDDLDGTIDEADEGAEGLACSDAPGRLVDLDASATVFASCIGGQAEYQFIDLGDGDGDGTTNEIVQDYSARTTTIVNPGQPSAYRVTARCSSETSCSASSLVLINFASAGQACAPVPPCEGTISLNRECMRTGTHNVGERVEFVANVANATGYQWSVSGNIIKDYEETATWKVIPMTPADFQAQSISFYWKPDGDQIHPQNAGPKLRTVSVVVTLQDNSLCELQTTVPVERNNSDKTRQAVDYYTTNHAMGRCDIKCGIEEKCCGRVLKQHEEWHESNEFDSPSYDGSLFFDFHSGFLSRFESWRKEFGYPPIGTWDPGTPIPADIDIDHDCRRSQYVPNPKPPSFKSCNVDMGPAMGRLQNGFPCDSVGGQKKLLSYPADQKLLGCAATGPWHNSIHGRVGGTMGGFTSPRDGLFWRWHAFVDGISKDRTNCSHLTPPRVSYQVPFRLFQYITDFPSTVDVTFDEDVTGVTVDDLTVNGSLATTVSGTGSGPYAFGGFVPPSLGMVLVEVAPGGIQDAFGNPFAGANWSYTLLDPVADEDMDGLLNSDEMNNGTDPFEVDTDHDGSVDDAEVTAGSDPLDEQSPCAGPAYSGTLTISKSIGSTTISWTPDGSPMFDVIRGDLNALRGDCDGDLQPGDCEPGDLWRALDVVAPASDVCLADNTASLSVTDTKPTGPGRGWFYLLRSVASCGSGGTYDTGKEIGNRDHDLHVSDAACD